MGWFDVILRRWFGVKRNQGRSASANSRTVIARSADEYVSVKRRARDVYRSVIETFSKLHEEKFAQWDAVARSNPANAQEIRSQRRKVMAAWATAVEALMNSQPVLAREALEDAQELSSESDWVDDAIERKALQAIEFLF